VEDIPMKVKKLLAGLMAGAVAISALTITASAGLVAIESNVCTYNDDDGNAGIYLKNTDGTTIYGDFQAEDVYGFKVVVTPIPTASEKANNPWRGGCITMMARDADENELIAYDTYRQQWGSANTDPLKYTEDAVANTATFTAMWTEAYFKSTDAVDILLFAEWNVSYFTLLTMDVLGKDGEVLYGDSIGSEKPVAPAAEAEVTEAPAEETTVEEAEETEAVAGDEPVDEGDEPVEEEVVPEEDGEIVVEDDEPVDVEVEEPEVVVEEEPEETVQETYVEETVVEATEAVTEAAPAAGDTAAEGNPKTGVALALIPAALAGVALITSRKRK
jgi:hypothetical protein